MEIEKKEEREFQILCATEARRLLDTHGIEYTEKQLIKLYRTNWVDRGDIMVELIKKRVNVEKRAPVGNSWKKVRKQGNQSGTFVEKYGLRKPQDRHEISKTLATRVCTALLAKLNLGAEIQAMMFEDGDIVLAANKSDANDHIRKVDVKGIISAYAQELDGEKWNIEREDQAAMAHEADQVRQVDKLIKSEKYRTEKSREAANEQHRVIFLKSLETIAKRSLVKHGGGVAEFQSWVTDPNRNHGIFWLSTEGKCHAEQALVAALLASGMKTPVTIAGTKRNCTTCWLLLKFSVDHSLLTLTYPLGDSPPGGYWSESSRDSMKQLMENGAEFMDERGWEHREDDITDDVRKEAKEMVTAALVDTFDTWLNENFPKRNYGTRIIKKSKDERGAVPSPLERRTPSFTQSDDERMQEDNEGAKDNEKFKVKVPKQKTEDKSLRRFKIVKSRQLGADALKLDQVWVWDEVKIVAKSGGERYATTTFEVDGSGKLWVRVNFGSSVKELPTVRVGDLILKEGESCEFSGVLKVGKSSYKSDEYETRKRSTEDPGDDAELAHKKKKQKK
ncbi:hypothetical protein ACFYM0_33370 [Streptomyces sp. NPDC006487]|uniref:hypothetical protein n=1 Tax=Streptomyces sp. NPDC006487 TaxID=3364748 RepID=UPI00367FFC9F